MRKFGSATTPVKEFILIKSAVKLLRGHFINENSLPKGNARSKAVRSDMNKKENLTQKLPMKPAMHSNGCPVKSGFTQIKIFGEQKIVSR